MDYIQLYKNLQLVVQLLQLRPYIGYHKAVYLTHNDTVSNFLNKMWHEKFVLAEDIDAAFVDNLDRIQLCLTCILYTVDSSSFLYEKSS